MSLSVLTGKSSGIALPPNKMVRDNFARPARRGLATGATGAVTGAVVGVNGAERLAQRPQHRWCSFQEFGQRGIVQHGRNPSAASRGNGALVVGRHCQGIVAHQARQRVRLGQARVNIS